jgi:hypothetical protein
MNPRASSWRAHASTAEDSIGMSLLVDSRAVQLCTVLVFGWTNCTERFGVTAQPDALQPKNAGSKITNLLVGLIGVSLTWICNQ